MLIEDNPDHVLLTQAVLELCPRVRQVMVIGDGEQALSYIRTDAASSPALHLPGLVLLDLKLPKVDGLDVLRAIRASPVWQRVPVVVLSTSTRPADIEACYAGGANAYLSKVAAPEALNTQICALADYWLNRAAAPGEEL